VSIHSNTYADYHASADDSPRQPGTQSPESAAMIQFRTDLRREMKIEVREEFQRMIGEMMEPIEQVLTNELPNISRNVKERLTRSLLGVMPYSISSVSKSTGVSEHARTTQPSYTTEPSSSTSMQPFDTGFQEFSQYVVPPESTTELWPQIANSAMASEMWSDSAYHSLPVNAQQISFDDVSWARPSPPSTADANKMRQPDVVVQHTDGGGFQSFSDIQPIEDCARKGKERAVNDYPEIDENVFQDDGFYG
jgi:hypothetical protein